MAHCYNNYSEALYKREYNCTKKFCEKPNDDTENIDLIFDIDV